MKRKLKLQLSKHIKDDANITKLSKEWKLSRQTIYALLSGRAIAIEFETIEKLCNGLNITPAELFVMESSAPKP